MHKDTRGVAGLTLVLVVLLLVAVGYAAYTVFYQDNNEVVDNAQSSSQQEDVSTTEQPVETAEDIERELSEIENIDLDSELDTSGLEEDINAI